MLLTGEPGQEVSLPESQIAGRFAIRRASLSEIESRLREWDADAVLVFMERYTEELARLVKLWKGVRPRAQFFLFVEHAPSTRALVGLMHAGFQDVIDRPATRDMAAVLDALEERIRFVRVHQLERLHAKQSVLYTGLVG